MNQQPNEEKCDKRLNSRTYCGCRPTGIHGYVPKSKNVAQES